MKRALLLPLTLAACVAQPANPVSNPGDYVPTSAPVPFAVQRLLPRGVTATDVLVEQNCYGYEFDGAVYPVIIPRGTQYCL
ncbi:MAG: hypothetical protein AAGE03_11820 [Pseudomonadota bacterium]